MKYFLFIFFIFQSSLCFGDSSELIGSWVLVGGYCEDGSELSEAIKSDIANSVKNQTTRIFEVDGTSSIITEFNSLFSKSICRAKAVSSYKVDDKSGIIYTEVLKTEILDCPATNFATNAVLTGLSLFDQQSVTFNFEIIENQLHLKSPYVSSQDILNCGNAARVVKVFKKY